MDYDIINIQVIKRMYMTSNEDCTHRYTITYFASSDNINFKIEYV